MDKPNNQSRDIGEEVKARVQAEAEQKKKGAEEKRKKRQERIEKEKIKKATDAGGVVPNISEEITDDDIEGYLNENRVGDAKLFARLYRDKFVFVVNWNLWLFWAGHHWLEDVLNQKYQAMERVWRLYQRYADNKLAEADKEKDKNKKAALQKLAQKALRRVDTLTDTNGQERLLEMCKRIEKPLLAQPEQFDKHPELKACPNGVIDLRSGDLYAGRPDDYLLKSIPVSFDKKLFEAADPCPRTNQFLLSSLDNDQEVVDFIWRLLGYGMITRRADHIFVIFWGEHGRNGKDTLIKLVTKVMGEELSGDVSVEMFLQTQTRSSSSSSPDILDLRGMCIAWINEAESNQKFALAKLKKLTGGGMLSARGNYDKGITRWEQTHLPIMTTNELPRAKADDAAFWARALIVKWPFSFVSDPDPNKPHEKPEIKDLDTILAEEKQGVLARMVQGAKEYYRDGLKVPKKVKEWTQEQRLNFDDIGQFMAEWCIREPVQDNDNDYKTKISASELYDAFCLWYAINRDKRYSISSRRFGEMLNKKNVPLKRSNGSWRLGITLTSEADNELYLSRQNKG